MHVYIIVSQVLFRSWIRICFSNSVSTHIPMSMTGAHIHASMCFRVGALAMLKLSRKISYLSTTIRSKAWCQTESLNSSWRQWGNHCQQPSASPDTRGELDRFISPVHTPELVCTEGDAQYLHGTVKWMNNLKIIIQNFTESLRSCLMSAHKISKIQLKFIEIYELVGFIMMDHCCQIFKGTFCISAWFQPCQGDPPLSEGKILQGYSGGWDRWSDDWGSAASQLVIYLTVSSRYDNM